MNTPHSDYYGQDEPPPDNPGKPKETLTRGEWIAVATLLAVIAQAIIYYYTLGEVQKTAEATRQAAVATQTQANLSAGQAHTLQDQSNTMREQTNTMKDSLTETQKLVRQNDRAVKAGEIQAKTSQVAAGAAMESASVARQAFEIGERPIVVVKWAQIKNLEPNVPVNAEVMLRNVGRTPARDIHVTAEVEAHPGYVYFLGFPKSDARAFSTLFLAAGDETGFITAPADAITIPEKFLADVTQNKEFLIIHGNGSYRNLAGKLYSLEEYCFYYFGKYGQFIPCSPDMYGAGRKRGK